MAQEQIHPLVVRARLHKGAEPVAVIAREMYITEDGVVIQPLGKAREVTGSERVSVPEFEGFAITPAGPVVGASDAVGLSEPDEAIRPLSPRRNEWPGIEIGQPVTVPSSGRRVEGLLYDSIAARAGRFRTGKVRSRGLGRPQPNEWPVHIGEVVLLAPTRPLSRAEALVYSAHAERAEPALLRPAPASQPKPKPTIDIGDPIVSHSGTIEYRADQPGVTVRIRPSTYPSPGWTAEVIATSNDGNATAVRDMRAPDLDVIRAGLPHLIAHVRQAAEHNAGGVK